MLQTKVQLDKICLISGIISLTTLFLGPPLTNQLGRYELLIANLLFDFLTATSTITAIAGISSLLFQRPNRLWMLLTGLLLLLPIAIGWWTLTQMT